MVKIHQLLAFDAVVRLGSFAHAAKALHVTPAALSLSMKELEDRLGFKLLERTTRSLRLTEAGRGYLSFVQRVLAELADADRYAREIKQGHGVVRIATTQTIMATLLAPALHHVHERWPHLRVHLVDTLAGTIEDSLVSRQADLAIGVRLPNDDQFTSQPFFRSRWCAYVSPMHPLGKSRSIRWSDLVRTRLFMNTASTMFLQTLLDQGVRPTDVQSTSTASSGMAMAATGLGVGVFPGYARPLAAVGGLRALPIQDPLVEHMLEIAVARMPSTPAPMQSIMELMTEVVSQTRARVR